MPQGLTNGGMKLFATFGRFDASLVWRKATVCAEGLQLQTEMPSKKKHARLKRKFVSHDSELP